MDTYGDFFGSSPFKPAKPTVETRLKSVEQEIAAIRKQVVADKDELPVGSVVELTGGMFSDATVLAIRAKSIWSGYKHYRHAGEKQPAWILLHSDGSGDSYATLNDLLAAKNSSSTRRNITYKVLREGGW